jgi:hypothetical protein
MTEDDNAIQQAHEQAAANLSDMDPLLSLAPAGRSRTGDTKFHESMLVNGQICVLEMFSAVLADGSSQALFTAPSSSARGDTTVVALDVRCDRSRRATADFVSTVG